MNDIQYISTVNKDKQYALKNKQNINKTKCLFLKKDATHEDIKQLVKNGCTFARIGTTSNYIVLDIDESNVTHEEMHKFEEANKDILVAKSISGKEYKHHVFFFTKDYSISEQSIEQYTLLVKSCFERLTQFFYNKCIVLDKNAWSYWQCMYSFAEENKTFTLNNSIQLNKWCKKFEEPVVYIETDEEEDDKTEEHDDLDVYLKKTKKEQKKMPCLVPNRARTYMTMLLENEYAVHLYKRLPFQLVKPVFVKTGYRHHALFKLTNIVCTNTFICRFFGLEYTDYDIVKTIEHYVTHYYEDGQQLWKEEENHVWNTVLDIMNNLLDKYESFGQDNSLTALIASCPSVVHRYGFETYLKNRMSNSFEVVEHADSFIEQECINYYGNDEHILECRKIFNKIIKEHNMKALRISFDENEQKRIYEATKDIQIFDDMPPVNTTFEDFKNKTSTGMKIETEETDLKLDRKEHKQHSQKGKCIEKYDIENNIVYIPKDEVTCAIRKYCSKNKIKIKRI